MGFIIEVYGGSNMTQQTALITQSDKAAIELLLNGLTSDHSKRAYSKALRESILDLGMFPR
jgi:hypothetical protein